MDLGYTFSNTKNYKISPTPLNKFPDQASLVKLGQVWSGLVGESCWGLSQSNWVKVVQIGRCKGDTKVLMLEFLNKTKYIMDLGIYFLMKTIKQDYNNSTKQDKYTMDPGQSSLSQQKEKTFWSTKTNKKNA